MIIVDESDPIDDLEPAFPYRDVTIRRDASVHDSYEMLDEIGRGKFGRVYRCRDKATGLTLATKIVSTRKKEQKRNVEREVEIMKGLRHPRLIQLFDAIEDVSRDETCLVLEMVGGGELFDRVIQDDFVLSERACAVFIRQICEALEYMHSKSIIHLDMKPENVMCLSKNGNRIKIIDFGLARFYDPKKKLQVLFGTPDFVSPECVSFDEITLASDLWSVGVITYVLLSGLSPFMGENDMLTMANVTIGKYDFDDEAFDDISEDATDFISKLLVKEKSSRLTANQCLKHPWLLPASYPRSTFAKPTKKSSVKAPSRSNSDGEEDDEDESSQDEGTSKSDLNDDKTQENGHHVNSFVGADDSSDVSSSSSSSPVPPPSVPVEVSQRTPSNSKAVSARRPSLESTKEHLKQFVSNWTDTPYLFDSSREIISQVCSTSASPSPHHFDPLRGQSYQLTTDSASNSDVNSKPTNIVSTINPNSCSKNANPVKTHSKSKTSINISNSTASKPVAYECGVNIVSQIRKFSNQFHEELELRKTNGTSSRKCPVNVK